MKRYRVEFSDTAESELVDSIIWGITYWGEEHTFRWAREFRKKVETSLESTPLAYPVAPESKWAPVDVRRFIVGRYRVLFEIRGKIVNILHIRGSFTKNPQEHL
jgi:plasmid stabilization system protein ParE